MHYILGILFFIFLCIAFGRLTIELLHKIVKKWTGQTLSSQTHPSIDFFIGQGIVSFFWIYISFFFPHPWNFLVFISMSVFPVRKLRLSRLLQKAKPFHYSKLPEILLFMLVMGLILFYLVLSTQKSTEWDDVSYHQPVVEEISHGKIRFPLLQSSPYIDFYSPFSAFYGSLPFNFESAASALYSLTFFHDSAAQILNICNIIFFLLLIFSLLKSRYGTDKSAFLIISFLILSNHGISLILTTGLIDLSAAIFQVLSLIYILLAIEKKSKLFLYLSVIFISVSFGHKFTSLYLLPAYALLFFIAANKIMIKSMDFILLIALGISFGFHWYIKNLLLHLNPVYPLFLGHRGLTKDDYNFLIDSLINNIRTPNTIENLAMLIKTSYKPETSTQITAILTLFSLARFRKKNKGELILIISLLSFSALNYLIGSQLSRYIIAFPLTLHILSYPMLKNNTFVKYGVLCLVIFNIFNNPLQFSIFQSRFSSIYNLVILKKINDNSQCSKEVVEYLTRHQVPKLSVLNLWDPYASVFYRSSELFYNFHGGLNVSNFVLPKSISFIYINREQMNARINNEVLHRNMKPYQRYRLQAALLEDAKLLLSRDNCMLFMKGNYDK